MSTREVNWAESLGLFEDERVSKAKMDFRNHLNSELSKECENLPSFRREPLKANEANSRIEYLFETIRSELSEQFGIEGEVLQFAFLRHLLMRVGR